MGIARAAGGPASASSTQLELRACGEFTTCQVGGVGAVDRPSSGLPEPNPVSAERGPQPPFPAAQRDTRQKHSPRDKVKSRYRGGPEPSRFVIDARALSRPANIASRLFGSSKLNPSPVSIPLR